MSAVPIAMEGGFPLREHTPTAGSKPQKTFPEVTDVCVTFYPDWENASL